MVKITDKQQINTFWGQLGSNMISLTGLHQLFLIIAADHTEVSLYLADRQRCTNIWAIKSVFM